MLFYHTLAFSHRYTSSISSLSTSIPRFTTPFTLTSLEQIRFSNSNSPNLQHMCVHLNHHLDFHHISIKHTLPISDTKLSSNTTLNIYFTKDFSSLSSKLLNPVLSSEKFISNISHIPKSSTHAILPYFQVITFLRVPC